MLTKIQEYEQKLKLIENSYLEELEKNKKISSILHDLKEQYEKTREECAKFSTVKQTLKEK